MRRKSSTSRKSSTPRYPQYNLSFLRPSFILNNLLLQTPADIQRITEMLRDNFMFANLTAIQRDQIFKVMTLKSVKANEVIIEEGAKGNEMYIVDR